jgi:hypothetical protein
MEYSINTQKSIISVTATYLENKRYFSSKNTVYLIKDILLLHEDLQNFIEDMIKELNNYSSML